MQYLSIRTRAFVYAIVAVSALAIANHTHAVAIYSSGNGGFAAKDISLVTGRTGLSEANLATWLQAQSAFHTYREPNLEEIDFTRGRVVGDYLVQHQGASKGGPPGGTLIAVQIAAAEPIGKVGSVQSEPAIQQAVNVPDGGSTALLLGGALSALGLLCRGWPRKA